MSKLLRTSACLVVMASAACAPAVAPTPTALPVKLRVSDQVNVSAAPIYIALDQGYFKTENLDVELVSMPPNLVVESVATDQVQFGMTLPSPSLFNALDQGVNIKIVASAIVNKPDDRPAGFVVRQDLIDSGAFKSASDLRGQTIAAAPDASQFYAERFLQRGGLTREDVHFAAVSEQNEVLPAFASRSIAAAWLPEPFVTAAERQGLGRMVASTGELFPGAATQTLIMSPMLAERQPEVAKRFLRAYIRGLRTYYHTIKKADADRGPVDITLANHTPIKDPSLYASMGLPSMDPNGTLALDSWQVFQAYFVQRGLQNRVLDLQMYVDTSLLDAALASLGREP